MHITINLESLEMALSSLDMTRYSVLKSELTRINNDETLENKNKKLIAEYIEHEIENLESRRRKYN